MTLTPSQIEVLARFDGWVKGVGQLWRKPEGLHNTRTIDDTAIVSYLTSPSVLIEMRLKLMEKLDKSDYWHWMQGQALGYLILNKEYTAAAIKTNEIIQKLEA